MGWRIVRQPNGKLARFSEVVDDFTHYDMTAEEAFDVCLEEMGRAEAIMKVSKGIADSPTWKCPDSGHADGLDRWRDAIDTIRFVHGEERARERERELSK